MQLTPTEKDRLLLFTAAELARARRARGLRLNVPEATALVADTVAEAARSGLRLAEAVDAGRAVLGASDVLPGVADVVREVRVEAVFDDGTRLAVVPSPFGVVLPDPGGAPAPGSVLPAPGGREPSGEDVVRVAVTNTSTVPVSVTSHFHFFEANPRLRFDRAAAYGRHLLLPAGSAQRFDPGTTSEAALVPIAARGSPSGSRASSTDRWTRPGRRRRRSNGRAPAATWTRDPAAWRGGRTDGRRALRRRVRPDDG